MSKYTTQVRYICENFAGYDESQGYLKVDSIIRSARPKVFNFDYPIFDENYRSVLETKILRHYYTREIGMETVGLWQLRLETKLVEIMPYYNKLYESELLKFNPLYDVDITEERTHSDTTDDDTNGTNTRTDNLQTNVNSKSADRYSDTPQGGLSGIESDRYLTSARIVDNTGTSSNTGTQTNNNVVSRDINTFGEYFSHIYGKRGGTDFADLLRKYRETFLNIDLMIIDELSDLFMLLW